MRSKPQNDGFSLPEIILVLVFIVILIAIAVPNVNSMLRAAREGAAVGNVRSIVSAQALFFRGDGRFGIFEELFKKKLLSEGAFTRNAPGAPSGKPTSGPTEEISDGGYQYSFRYEVNSTGYTLDADPKTHFRATYRRFRFRVNRSAAGGASGSKEVMLAAKPSVSSPATTAYKVYNP